MRRRQMLGLATGAVAWPFAAHAQQLKHRIGVLVGAAEGDAEGQRWVQAFLEGLQATGWHADKNIKIDIRWAANDLDKITKFAKELVELKPDLIQVTSTPAVAAILRESKNIPLVFGVVTDPVGQGFVQNLSHPGGKVTGFSNFDPSLVGKWAQLLKELVPSVTNFILLFNPKTAPYIARYSDALESESQKLGIATESAPYEIDTEIATIISSLAKRPGVGLIVMPDISNQANRKSIISLTAMHRVPAVYPFRFFVRDGGLASYGVNLPDQQRGAAIYADRILKGENPGDLPVQLPTTFELAVNLKTADALGLNLSPLVLARADEVIE